MNKYPSTPQEIAEVNEQIREFGAIIESDSHIINGQNRYRTGTHPIVCISPEGHFTSPAHLKHRTKAAIIEAVGGLVIPGGTDLHVHTRDGAQAHKETWDTFSQAALAGGVTTAFGMPNTNPFTDSADRLKERLQLAASGSRVNYSEYMGTLGDNLDELNSPLVQQTAAGIKVYLNDTTGGFTISPQAALKLAQQLKDKNNQLTFVLHAEGETLEKIAKPLLLLGHRVHVAHISLASEVELVRQLQKANLPITAEVTPHHLLIAIDSLREQVRTDLCDICVMKPPLSPLTDIPALYHGLYCGTIAAIATDHAPHTLAEKLTGQAQGNPVFGVTGIQEMLPLLFSHLPNVEIPRDTLQHLSPDIIKTNLLWNLPLRITNTDIVAWTSTQPAQLAKIKDRGAIQYGNWADLAIIDPHAKYKIGDKDHPLYSRAGWSPYEGWPVTHEVVTTMVNGQIAYSNGCFATGKSAQQTEFRRK